MKESLMNICFNLPKAYLILSLLLVFFSVLCFNDNIEAGEKDIPFSPGEKLTFELRWGFIPAGEAVLHVLPFEKINGNGVDAYHFVITIRSNSFVDIFYKVRDRVDAYTDREITHSLLYKKNQQEGKSVRNVVVTFDWEKNEAQYSNFGEKLKPVSIKPGSFDPFSIMYYARLFDPEKNPIIKRPVTDGKKCVIGIGKVIKRETIKIGSRTYDTYLIEPELKHIGGVFRKSKNAKIVMWLTADNRRIPVKLKSKVVVGSFTGELVSIQYPCPKDMERTCRTDLRGPAGQSHILLPREK